MVQLYQNIGLLVATAGTIRYAWQLVPMLILLACSAFFSGSETAFFNLSPRQINQLNKSEHKIQKLVAEMLNRPRQLLSCLLLGNMTVNVLFYALASVLIVTIERQIGVTAATVAAALTFVILVLFGEILPKSLAYSGSKTVSILVALPVFLCLKLLTPVLFVFRSFITEPILRLLLGPEKHPEPLSAGEFKSLIEASRKKGLITPDENRLLTEIIEIGFLKVRHVMRPRVDMIACPLTNPPHKAREIMLKNHLVKLPVYDRTIDNILGLVHLRRILLQPDDPLDKLVQRVDFVPEQKTVESLLEFFRKSRTDMAVVVDEYGGIAGSVCLEDIAEELLGPIEITKKIEPVERIGPMKYRLAGNLAIHDWAEAFGIELSETRLSTVGGLITALLGKIPKTGDVAYLKNLSFTIENVRKHRIETLLLTLEPTATDD